MTLRAVFLAGCIAVTSLPGISLAGDNKTATAAIEQAVLAAATSNWEAASRAHLPDMLAPILPTNKGAYAAQSEVWWTREDTVEFFHAAFEGVARQELDWERETVMVLSATSALYVGKGVYRQYDSEDALLIESPHAVSMVYVLVEGEWRIRHFHQSFPDSAQ